MIVLKSLTLRRGAKVVLDGVSVTLNPGEKVGLVGRNGAGKSSLFALFAGRLQADAGDASMPPTWRIAEVMQSMPETAQPATEFVLDGDQPLRDAKAALAAAERANDGHAIADAHLGLEHAGAFDARARAEALLLGLGFKAAQLDSAVASFSGGWRMRIALARALMSPAELLLLDEPTNHLDLDALVWLEAWLQRNAATLVVISHDREFLDAVTRVTLHIDDAQLTRYGGNYSAFELQRAERMAQQRSAYSRQQERIEQLQRFIDRFKAKASKAKQAQSRVKALERMEKLAPALAASDFELEFREPASLPNPMLVLDGLECGYAGQGEHGVHVLKDVSVSVLRGQRIGILGANGQGKSTLVKTIARALPPLAGTLTEGKGLAIGYFAQQELDLLHEDDTPLQQMVRLAAGSAREQELRDFLGRFRFSGDMVHQRIGTLSGGEQARLVLATIVWQRPNLLLLDEPTNHLDLDTREALSMALNEFEGTLLVVSHDRALLREVCDEFWLVAGGVLRPFDGDLDDYQRWLIDNARAAARSRDNARAGARSTDNARAAARSNDNSRAATRTSDVAQSQAQRDPTAGSNSPRDDRKARAASRLKASEETKALRAELKRIDQRLVGTADSRDAALAALAADALSPAERAEQGRRLKALDDEVQALETRWLEVSEALEQMAAGRA